MPLRAASPSLVKLGQYNTVSSSSFVIMRDSRAGSRDFLRIDSQFAKVREVFTCTIQASVSLSPPMVRFFSFVIPSHVGEILVADVAADSADMELFEVRQLRDARNRRTSPLL